MSNNPESALPQHQKDLYAILEVARDANSDEVRSAYKSKALLFHPDRSGRLVGADQKSKDYVNDLFNDLREAYDVLSDPLKRSIYDDYGYKGLRARNQLGSHHTETADVRREIDRMEQIRRIREYEKRMFGFTNLTAHIDARKLFQRQGSLEVPWLIMQQFVETPLTDEVTLAMEAQAEMKNGQGSATLSAFLARKLVMGVFQSGVQISMGDGGEMTLIPSVALDAPVDEDKRGSLRASMHPSHGPIVDFGVRQNLFPNVDCTLNVSHQINDVKMRAEIKAKVWENSKVSAEVSIGTMSRLRAKLSLMHGLWVDCSASVAFILSSAGIKCRLGVERKFSELSHGTLSAILSQGSVGLFGTLKRGAHKISIPIHISADPSALLGVFIACVPGMALFTYENVIKACQIRAHVRMVSQARSASLGRVQEEREKALVAQRLMRERAQEKKAIEEERNGLVIVRARYGNLHAREGDRTEHPDFPSWIDVTIVIQNLVERSRVEFNSNMSHLHGFYDPCPGETKWLEVEYRFKGLRHIVEVKQDGELRIPLSTHIVRE